MNSDTPKPPAPYETSYLEHVLDFPNTVDYGRVLQARAELAALRAEVETAHAAGRREAFKEAAARLDSGGDGKRADNMPWSEAAWRDCAAAIRALAAKEHP